MVRSRAFLPTLRSVGEQASVTTMSSRSSTSSCAVASRVRTKASNVAMRRSSGMRATACALATVAKRASAATRPGGTCRGPGRPSAQQPHLVEPPDGAGQLGAAAQVWAVAQPVERARPAALASNQQGVKLRTLLGCDVAGEGAPQTAGGSGADARDQRSSADAPGRSTFSVTSQTVARSNSTLGRSVPVQHRA